jgi:hypothetical protein
MPVQFNCPSCRRRLSVTRRKVGHQVTCPKCTAPIVVPASQPALVGAADRLSVPAELDQLRMDGLADFTDLSDLMVDEPMLRPVRLPKVTPAEVAPAPERVLISRTSIYLQAVLLVLVAAVAFGLGYWLGGSEAQSAGQGALSAERG